jgi:hypothetical protein
LLKRLSGHQSWSGRGDGLRRKFGPNGEEETRYWRKLYNEDFNSLYLLQDIRVVNLRRMRWVGCVAHMVFMRNAYRISVGKPESKRPL